MNLELACAPVLLHGPVVEQVLAQLTAGEVKVTMQAAAKSKRSLLARVLRRA